MGIIIITSFLEGDLIQLMVKKTTRKVLKKYRKSIRTYLQVKNNGKTEKNIKRRAFFS